eukprot:TRINITY_DN6830_c0_g1_i1.p1 TRINITY_DN6830_c0_g1~~TRINITY_DN6830_c0_g1_i1.p1  ORF type:complete len:228 (+),score=39.75 TRINITY_DN6830_c0_g1_i1:95-685(+)
MCIRDRYMGGFNKTRIKMEFKRQDRKRKCSMEIYNSQTNILTKECFQPTKCQQPRKTDSFFGLLYTKTSHLNLVAGLSSRDRQYHRKRSENKQGLDAAVVNVAPWTNDQFLYLYKERKKQPSHVIINGPLEKHYPINYDIERLSTLTETHYVNGEQAVIIYEEMTDPDYKINASIIQHPSEGDKVEFSAAQLTMRT